MSDYIFLVNVGDDIVNSVCLTSFVPNRRKYSTAEINFKVGVYTQKFDSVQWVKLGEARFNNNNIVLSSLDYNLAIGELAVVVPSPLDFIFLDRYDELPEPISRKSDETPVNERASIYFYKDKSFSSFQGEYPYQMTKVKGSFLAFDSLMKYTNKNINTRIAFINIYSKKLSTKKNFYLNIANSDSKVKIISTKYVHNSVGIIDISSNDGIERCIYSKDTLGIPIFISYNDLGYLSVEHSHPPSELFLKNSVKGQNLLKKNWLNKLP